MPDAVIAEQSALNGGGLNKGVLTVVVQLTFLTPQMAR